MKSRIFNIFLLTLAFLQIGFIYYGLITHNEIKSDFETQIVNLNSEIKEKDSKIKENSSDRDSIRNIWEEQTAVNDEIIISQTETLQTLNDFLRILDDSITVSQNSINLKTQEKSGELLESRKNLEIDLLKLEKSTGENVTFKEQAKTKIDDIYLRIGRDQPNTAPTE